MKQKQDVSGITTGSAHPNLPKLPLAAWEDSKRTLHLYTQVVGKVRMALHPKLNHWVARPVLPRVLGANG